MRSRKSKQCDQKNLVHRKMADRAITDHGGLTVKNPKSVDGKVADENLFPPRQGYLPKLVTKMNEIPTTFESSVVK